MGYLVLARKYRPDTFERVVGQEAVARTLQNALRTGRLAHAYLFTGARGVGKTSLARILSKALQCAEGPTPTPCGTCDRCVAVAQGSDLDVVEIDGASNRGIENIRDLRESVRYAPTQGRYKVYIVDEVHQITHDAFNAFLKTLEEPPAHVVFVFATTEPSKVPETIRSRCQEFEFRRIPEADIARHVRELCASESLDLEEGMDKEIARRARGGLRDALSLLDQLAAYGAGKVTFEAFRELTGFLAPTRLAEFVDRLVNQQTDAALDWISEALDHGASGGDLIDQLLDYLRSLLHRRAGSQHAPALPGVSDAQAKTQAESLDEGHLLGLMQVLVEARRLLRDLDDPRLVLEMVTLEMARMAELPQLRSLLERFESGGAPSPGAASPRSGHSAPRSPSSPSRPASPANASRSEPRKPTGAAAQPKAPPRASTPSVTNPNPQPRQPPSSGSAAAIVDKGASKAPAGNQGSSGTPPGLNAVKLALRKAAPSLLASLGRYGTWVPEKEVLHIDGTTDPKTKDDALRLLAWLRTWADKNPKAGFRVRATPSAGEVKKENPAHVEETLDQVKKVFGGETVSE